MVFRLELIKKTKSFSQTHLLPFSCKYEELYNLLLNTNTQGCIDSNKVVKKFSNILIKTENWFFIFRETVLPTDLFNKFNFKHIYQYHTNYKIWYSVISAH